MLTTKTELAKMRAILDSTRLHISRYPSLCPHIFFVASVANVSCICTSAAPASPNRIDIGF